MQTDAVRLEFAYAYEDFHSALRWRDRFRWLDIAGWLTVLAVALAVFWRFGEKIDPARFGQLLGASGFKSLLPLAAMVAVGFILWWSRRGSRTAWEKTNAHEIYVITLSPAGILLERAASRTELKWEPFKKWEETEKGFILRSDANSMLLPRRVITENQAAILRSLLKEHITTTRGFEVLAHEKKI